MNVADALIPKTYASGDVIVRQGDAAHGMFFLEGGICEVFVESGRGNRKKVISSYVLTIGHGIGRGWPDWSWPDWALSD
jgi:signal-transduction protein with cAMP-binding, CBS, and nucleotidyltransferase domain